jgi:flap endonuclease-1
MDSSSCPRAARLRGEQSHISSTSQVLFSPGDADYSHLMGFFYRTLRMIDCGIKPMYVFDGKPPDLKAKVLQGRYGRREEAREEEEAEKDVGEWEELPQNR